MVVVDGETPSFLNGRFPTDPAFPALIFQQLLISVEAYSEIHPKLIILVPPLVDFVIARALFFIAGLTIGRYAMEGRDIPRKCCQILRVLTGGTLILPGRNQNGPG